MGVIIDFDENIPHTVSEVICVKCGFRWISVRPSSVLLKKLECKNCGTGYVIETGQEFDYEE
jgi:heterodisulfide reductase subunit A-like polyferredoxin